MTLILTPLAKALASLEEGLALPKSDITRDACIQRFEYSFELSWKLLKRYVSENASLKETSIKGVFREAGKLNLIDNVEAWFGYLQARNLTSHTYNEETADETYIAAQSFLKDAKSLLKKLQEANG